MAAPGIEADRILRVNIAASIADGTTPTVHVSITEQGFVPSSITATIGTKVIWHNELNVPAELWNAPESALFLPLIEGMGTAVGASQSSRFPVFLTSMKSITAALSNATSQNWNRRSLVDEDNEIKGAAWRDLFRTSLLPGETHKTILQDTGSYKPCGPYDP